MASRLSLRDLLSHGTILFVGKSLMLGAQVHFLAAFAHWSPRTDLLAWMGDSCGRDKV